MLRWQLDRLRQPRRVVPPAEQIPFGTPRVPAHSAPDELRITWVGQSTFLLQIGGLNILTDPVWSLRASPIQWIGPARLRPPGIAFEELPEIDVVLVSHDHYDHLDAPTVKRLAKRFPDAHWVAPLGHGGFLHKCGARQIVEADWWDQHVVAGVTFTATPAQHWTRRIGSKHFARLWCSFALRSSAHNIYFAGDSGYCPAFQDIGRREGPFDVAIIPIGAYEPRWFMKQAHMNPEEAVQVHADLKARHFIGMHWGTFILTDEYALEPPQRTRARWQELRLPVEHLHLLGIGETFVLETP